MPDKRYFVMTMECARCKTKQKIHIANRTEVGQKGNEKILCVNCDHRFEVKVSDKLIRGRSRRNLSQTMCLRRFPFTFKFQAGEAGRLPSAQ